MSTVIDSLVVELSLDAHKLNEETRAALEQFKRTGEEAKKYASETEAHGKKTLEFFQDIKRVALGMTTLFLGGMGVKEFVTHMTNLEAATGRVARTMDVSTEELSAWQGMARQLGGTTEGITGTLQGLSSELNKFGVTGETALFGPLSRVGVSMMDLHGNLKTSTQLFNDIADAAARIAPDPAQRRAILSLFGMDQDAINIAMKTRAEREKMLDDQRKAFVVTKEEADAASALQRSWSLFIDTASSVGKALLGDIAGPLQAVLDKTTELVQEYPRVAKAIAAIGTAASAFFGAKAVLGVGKRLFGAGGEPAAAAAEEGGATAAAEDAVVSGTARAVAGRILGYFLGPLGALLAMTSPAGESDDDEIRRRAGRMGATTRGDRNNNPGNIKYGPFAIARGATSADSGGFAVFPDAGAGQRAMSDLLASKRYSGLTMSEIERRWVGYPDMGYLAAMTGATGLGAGAVPNLADPAVRAALMRGMSLGEGTHLIGAPAAALRHSSMVGGPGAGGAASSSRSTKIDIGEVNINAPGAARSADHLAAQIPAALRRQLALSAYDPGIA